VNPFDNNLTARSTGRSSPNLVVEYQVSNFAFEQGAMFE
jgi:hypothetical protein